MREGSKVSPLFTLLMLNNTASHLLQKTDDKRKVKYLGCLLQFMKLKTGRENLLFQGAAEVSNAGWEVFFWNPSRSLRVTICLLQDLRMLRHSQKLIFLQLSFSFTSSFQYPTQSITSSLSPDSTSRQDQTCHQICNAQIHACSADGRKSHRMGFKRRLIESNALWDNSPLVPIPRALVPFSRRFSAGKAETAIKLCLRSYTLSVEP